MFLRCVEKDLNLLIETKKKLNVYCCYKSGVKYFQAHTAESPPAGLLFQLFSLLSATVWLTVRVVMTLQPLCSDKATACSHLCVLSFSHTAGSVCLLSVQEKVLPTPKIAT